MEYTIKLLLIATIIVGNLQQQIYYSVPKDISITMNTDVYPSGNVSYMQVYGPAGDEVSIGNCIYTSKRTMRIPIRDEGAGTYVIVWNVLSADDMLEHQGVRTFVVNEINLPLLLLNGVFVACILSALFLITWRFTHHDYHRK
jgi:methionine-rich copper-binding protein CopC